MPRYQFIGHVETVLHGLVHGVNAVLHRIHDHDGCDCDPDPTVHGQPDGSTVVARPGDVVTTDQPYPHALLQDLDAAPDKSADPEPATAEADAAAPATVEPPATDEAAKPAARRTRRDSADSGTSGAPAADPAN